MSSIKPGQIGPRIISARVTTVLSCTSKVIIIVPFRNFKSITSQMIQRVAILIRGLSSVYKDVLQLLPQTFQRAAALDFVKNSLIVFLIPYHNLLTPPILARFDTDFFFKTFISVFRMYSYWHFHLQITFLRRVK